MWKERNKMSLLGTTLWLFIFCGFTPFGKVSSSKNVVCYQGTWSTYRPGLGKFDVENIDPFLCTHLVYAFFGIDEQSGDLRVIDPYLDLEDNNGRANIREFNALKLKNPTLKTLAAVGGWNEGSKKFSIVAADPQKRARFVDSVVRFLQRHSFDGIDLDWEYPGQRHSLKNDDRNNYITLLQELKEGLQPFGFMLSAAVGSAEFSASISYDIPKIVPYLDLINVMSYDLYGPWENFTGINAPLYAGNNGLPKTEQLNVDAIFKYWILKGAPKEKLVLGVPFYGRTFTLATAEDHNVGATSIGRGIAGQYSREPGTLGYNELCEKMLNEDWTVQWDDAQQAPYAYMQRQWVGYDNQQSLSLKAQYVMDHDLGGIMVWSIESDDFHGKCGNGPNPLLREINRVLFGQETPTGLSVNISVGGSASGSSSFTELESSGSIHSCTRGEGYERDPKNCSKFYYCRAGATFEFDCPPGLSFDYSSNRCNYSDSVKC